MKRENYSDKGARLGGGGYFSSFDEMQSPRHQAMHALLDALKVKRPKKFIQALDEVRKQGWDINKIVFQDSLDTWCTLGGHLASRDDVLMGRLFSAYLDYPGVDLSGQESLVRIKYMAYHTRQRQKNPEAFEALQRATRAPLAHVFLRQWAQHLPPVTPPPPGANDYAARNYQKHVELHELANEIFGKMKRMGVDWSAQDEHGNTLAHVLVERESSKTLMFLLPWLKDLGISMSSSNRFGMTPSVTGQMRIARAKARSSEDVGGFAETLAILEHDLLQDTTPQAPSTRRSLRF